MAVNVIADMLNHKDEEIVEFLSKTMNGIVKNYNVSLDKNSPELLWGNFGDIVMVSQALKAMDQRNKERLAQTQNQ